MSLWRNNSFVILFSGQIVSTIGDNLYGIALLWYVLDLTHSRSALAITGFATTLPPILGFVIGVWVDRWRKKSTLVVSDALRAGLLILLFFLSNHAHPSFWIIVSLVVLVEIVGTFFTPAFRAVLPMVVPKDQFANASGMTQSSGAFASLGGLLGGGALMAWMGAPLLFLSNGVSFLASVMSLCFVRVHEPKKPQQGDSSLIQEWKEGMVAILKSPYLVQSALTSTVNNFSLAAFGIAITVWVKDQLHGSAFLLATIIAAELVGILLGGLLSAWVSKKFDYRKVNAVTLIGLGLGVSFTGLWANGYWDMGVMFVAGVMLGLVDGVGGGLRMTVIPEDVRGRVFSILGTMSRLATPLGVAVLGTLMIYIHLSWVLLATGIGPVLGGVSYLLPYSKKAFTEIRMAEEIVVGSFNT
jgi:MFS transporter, DHA3 family, macrolide efflux protein